MAEEPDDMNRLKDLQIREAFLPQILKVFSGVLPRQLCKLECELSQCFLTWFERVEVRLSRSNRTGESLTAFCGGKVSQVGLDSVVTVIGLTGDDSDPLTFSGSQLPGAFHQLDIEFHKGVEEVRS